jgi:hypothetical protein
MSNFVIVVEVDNKRAHAAYLKGLADLDLIWPQIHDRARKEDEESSKEELKQLDKYNREMALFKEKMAEYHQKLEDWGSSVLFRGPKPSCPIMLPPCRSSYYRQSMESVYESMRSELKRMADLAGAAIGPYRMTEHQVSEMVGWEDGTQIGRIKATIAKKNNQ